MASVTMWVVLCNGEQAGAKVKVDESYPQSIAEAVHACGDAILETMRARRMMSDDE